MQGGGVDPDAAAEARRNYIIQRCRLPAAAMFGDHQALLHAAQEIAGLGAGAAAAAGQPPLPANAEQQELIHAVDNALAGLLGAHHGEGEAQAAEALDGEVPMEMDEEAGALRFQSCCSLRSNAHC